MRKLTSNNIEHLPSIDKNDCPEAGLAISLMVFVSKHYNSEILEMALRRIGYVKEVTNGRVNTNPEDRRVAAGESR